MGCSLQLKCHTLLSVLLKQVIGREIVKCTNAKKPLNAYIKFYPSRQIPYNTPSDL